MAYKWSGWDDIETFLRKVKEGHGAGTGGGAGVYNHFSVDCVVGTSCTGLVSRAWHLNRKYTLNYNDPQIKCRFFEITHDIEGASLRKHQSGILKKGDAFINRTHIVLYLYETRDGIPMIIDSRAPGVRFRAETWERLRYQGYKAIRYNNIKDTAKP
ncbi:MAG: hypothetical protein GY757_28195, partial [bacterium]|nr:hypothetical protein [bacterium]